MSMIVHIPLININIPANANTMLYYILQITNFNIIPYGSIIDALFNFNDTSAFND
jgi:hypothetical protein